MHVMAMTAELHEQHPQGHFACKAGLGGCTRLSLSKVSQGKFREGDQKTSGGSAFMRWQYLHKMDPAVEDQASDLISFCNRLTAAPGAFLHGSLALALMPVSTDRDVHMLCSKLRAYKFMLDIA